MRRVVVLTALVALTACAQFTEDARPWSITAEVYARIAQVSVQLSMRSAHAEGRISDDLYRCAQLLGVARFYSVTLSLLTQNLTKPELQASDAFFDSSAGRKFFQATLMMLYRTAGEEPAEPFLAMSDAEHKDWEMFAVTSAGQKLFVQKVLQGPSAEETIRARSYELLGHCRGNQ